MDKVKEVKLNAQIRKPIVVDYRKHLEQEDSLDKENFFEAREKATSAIDSAFNTAKVVLNRAYKPVDVADYKRLAKKYSSVDATGKDSCFFMSVPEETVQDEYDDEVVKSKHFSFKLDGSVQGDNRSRYGSGSSNNGKNFAYGMYREEMKGRGLNPDCNIENDINNKDSISRGHSNNPYLSQCRNDNQYYLEGKGGTTNHLESWKQQFALDIIGTGGCKSRAIPCTNTEFNQFEIMISAKQNVVRCHEKWIASILTKTKLFDTAIKQMRTFNQVEAFAVHPKINWTISPEILVAKTGTDVALSIDTLADTISMIGEAKPTRDQKLEARIMYEKAQVSSVN